MANIEYSKGICNLWYDIPSYPGYQINPDGLVRSMKFMYAKPGNILKPHNGRITLSVAGKKKVVTIFELLDDTFFGKIPPRVRNQIDYSARKNDKLLNGGKESCTIGMDFSKYVN